MVAKTSGVDVEESAVLFNEAKLLELNHRAFTHDCVVPTSSHVKTVGYLRLRAGNRDVSLTVTTAPTPTKV